MREWSVLVEARNRTATIEADDKRLVPLPEALVPHFGVVSSGGSNCSARIAVEASTAASAVELAVSIVEFSAKATDMPDWPCIRVEALRDDELERQIAVSWPNLERRGRKAGRADGWA